MARALSKFNMYTGEVEYVEVFTSDRSPPPQADMVQPLVGPPDAGQLSQEPAALARRQTLSEVKTFVEKERDDSVSFLDERVRSAWRSCCCHILQHLESLIGPEGQDAP